MRLSIQGMRGGQLASIQLPADSMFRDLRAVVKHHLALGPDVHLSFVLHSEICLDSTIFHSDNLNVCMYINSRGKGRVYNRGSGPATFMTCISAVPQIFSPHRPLNMLGCSWLSTRLPSSWLLLCITRSPEVVLPTQTGKISVHGRFQSTAAPVFMSILWFSMDITNLP